MLCVQHGSDKLPTSEDFNKARPVVDINNIGSVENVPSAARTAIQVSLCDRLLYERKSNEEHASCRIVIFDPHVAAVSIDECLD